MKEKCFQTMNRCSMEHLEGQQKGKRKKAAAAVKGFIIMLTCGFCLTLYACGGKECYPGQETPREAMETAMEAVCFLDMETLNRCTDNEMLYFKSFMGMRIPFFAEKEYRIFNEIIPPGQGRHYRRNRLYYKKMTERLVWNIKEVRVQEYEGSAEIDMEFTNIDMADVWKKWERHLDEETEYFYWTDFIGRMTTIKDDFITIMEETDQLCTMEVTATAWKGDNGWVIHLSDELINGFLGNIYEDERME